MPNIHYVNGAWDLIQQCKKQKVKIFFKQCGGSRPKSGGRIIRGKTFNQFPKMKPFKITHKKRFETLQEKLKVIRDQQHSLEKEITQTIKIQV